LGVDAKIGAHNLTFFSRPY